MKRVVGLLEVSTDYAQHKARRDAHPLVYACPDCGTLTLVADLVCDVCKRFADLGSQLLALRNRV